ncbi:uncharacterized protein GGS22DRAFT_182993 [Annulohypoxylon maeteangense]|uniref:uncharacterized protein n=1 Tax=Annulohypoxylon maeteangense TaxID=1927788 RepID=UPI002007D80C|nr:uncharacterized protein GGS22DRAFT_182993 [Annulohypoxylon maeteangense]KAI0889649.1 hypothetical protein GGS22DRAFT_182993 [Annulohypoxylon maeteangense]
MDAQDTQELLQTASRDNAEPRPPLQPQLRELNRDFVFNIQTISTQNTNDTLTYCNSLLQTYQATGDETWLRKRRLTLQRYLVDFEYLNVHQDQGRNAVQEALELSVPHSSSKASPNKPDGQPADKNKQGAWQYALRVQRDYVCSKAVFPDDISDPNAPSSINDQDVEPYPRYTPPKVEYNSPEPEAISIRNKISRFWDLSGALRFTLSPTKPYGYVNPEVYLGRWDRKTNQWCAANWEPKRGGSKVKVYVILATENLPRGPSGSVVSKKKDLSLRVVHVGGTKLEKGRGRIFFRGIGPDWEEDIWCPLSGRKIKSGDISDHDLVFWVSEGVLEDFYHLHTDLDAEMKH